MISWLTALRRSPRQPLAGVALSALVGIAAAEAWRAAFLPRFGDGSTAAATTISLFTALSVAWWRCQREQPTLARLLFWSAATTAYAALHLLGSSPVAAGVLARRLAVPADAHVLRATGTVFDLPRRTPAFGGGVNWRFVVRLDTAGIDGEPPRACGAPVAVEWRDGPREVAIGDPLDLTAVASNVAPPRNPGEFDEETFLRRQGIFSELRLRGLADGRLLGKLPSSERWLDALRHGSLRAARRCHDWMAARLGDNLHDEPEASAVVATALLGLRDKPGLGTLEPAFQRTGTLHYFAIDGLKLGLVSLLLLRFLTFLGVPRPWPGLLVLPLLFWYALATGLGAASARAVLVAAALVGGEALDRPVRPVNSVSAAAAVLLAFDTQQLFELSFQLTFLVVLAILVLARPLRRSLLRFGAPDPFLPVDLFTAAQQGVETFRRWLFALVAVSLAAWVGSLPLMLLDFHFVSPVSPLANVIVFPFAFTVLSLGVLSLAGSVVWRMLGVWLNNTNWLFAKTLVFLVRVFDAAPGGSFPIAAPEHWRWQRPAAELVVLDLGRARAACLRAGSTVWLIDAARPLEYTRGVLPCLRARGVNRLDGLLLTQGDADHLAAARLALAEFSPPRVVDPALNTGSSVFRDFRRDLAGQQLETPVRRGDKVVFSPGVEAEVLYPPADLPGSLRAAADRALVLRIRAAGWRVLWLPESNGAADAWLLAHGSPEALKSDVIITAGTTIPAGLLAAARPRLVVLRPPVEREGQPGREDRAASGGEPTGVTTFRQAESGAVSMRFYPDRIEAHGFVDGREATLGR